MNSKGHHDVDSWVGIKFIWKLLQITPLQAHASILLLIKKLVALGKI